MDLALGDTILVISADARIDNVLLLISAVSPEGMRAKWMNDSQVFLDRMTKRGEIIFKFVFTE
jgi:hypothetical protein